MVAPAEVELGDVEIKSGEGAAAGADDTDSGDRSSRRRARRTSGSRKRATSRGDEIVQGSVPAAPEARPSETSTEREAPSASAPLRLRRIEFAPEIRGREPKGAEDTFARSEIDKLYAFVEVTNDARRESEIVVTFVPPSGSPSKVTLEVGDKSRWRTWALRRAPRALGVWRVLVTDERGRKLGERSFEVTE